MVRACTLCGQRKVRAARRCAAVRPPTKKDLTSPQVPYWVWQWGDDTGGLGVIRISPRRVFLLQCMLAEDCAETVLPYTGSGMRDEIPPCVAPSEHGTAHLAPWL